MFQAEGLITIGATDYSDEVVEFLVHRDRELVTGPATFGNIRAIGAAGSLNENVRITALNDIASASLAMAFWAALDTDTAEVTFKAKFTTAAIGASNPSYEGTFIVLGAEVGGTVNQHNQQTWTFPITTAGITLDTTP